MFKLQLNFADFFFIFLDFCRVKEQLDATIAVLDALLMVPGRYTKGTEDMDVLDEEGLNFPYTKEKLDNFRTKVSKLSSFDL